MSTSNFVLPTEETQEERDLLKNIKETRIIKIPQENGHSKLIDQNFDFAVELIRRGDVVAFPTETVYGLGANALDANAVKKIFLTKRRPQDNPLIVHISSLDMLPLVAKTVPEKARILMDKFWPGPLTILLEKSDKIPDSVVCDQPTVAVRMPSHPIAAKLISLCNVPIAAPSANLSGRPSPTTAQHVYEDLKNRCHCIIDGGPTPGGVESTVVDITRELILRPGGVTLEQLRVYIPNLEVYGKDHNPDLLSKPPTPGLKYRHYAPSAHVILLEGTDMSKMQNETIRLWREYGAKGSKIGLIHTHKSSITLPVELINDKNIVMVTLGDHDNDYKEVARGLFATLRDMDGLGVDIIIMEGISEQEEGLAVMNRIRKASKEIILC